MQVCAFIFKVSSPFVNVGLRRRGVLVNGSICGMCSAGSYMDPLANVCRECPAGSTAPSGSVGLLSCTCPSGSRLRSAELCEPCPLHTYSSSAGLACTPCPPLMVTAGVGSQSLRDCQCPPGLVMHAGRCVQASL